MINRPLCLFTVSFIGGILLKSYFSSNIILLIVLSLLILFIFLLQKVKKSAFVIFACLLFFIFGAIHFDFKHRAYTQGLEEYYGNPTTIEGYIADEPERDSDKVKFIIKTEHITLQKKEKLEVKLVVNLYSNGLALKEIGELGYRKRIVIQSVIKRPKSATNPGGFDYQRYLAGIGVSGTINLLGTSDLSVIGEEPGGWIFKLGYRIKNSVLRIIEYCLDKNQAGLLSGMIIGYKNGLDDRAFEAFSKAGLTHIMVASGMNVAFIMLPLLFLFDKLHIGRRSANILTMLALILFVFITGFSASVVRAVIMGCIILTGRSIMRETDIYTSISSAALILLVMNPYALFDIGFQLSFTATLSLVLFYPKLKKIVSGKYIPEVISDTLAATLAAQAGVIPITLYYFNNLSIISVLSNLLVVPLVQIITVIGFIMVFAGLLKIHIAVILGYINNTFLSYILFITEVSSKLPFSSVILPTPPIWAILVYYTVLCYIFLGNKRLKGLPGLNYLKVAVVAISIGIALISVLLPKPLRVTFLDVGQGDGAFIKTANGTKIIIDGGGSEAGTKSTFDMGESVMVPYILDQGTKFIDIVVASHSHADHSQGLEAILRELRVGVVILPDTDGTGFERIREICIERGIKIEECRKGDNIKVDNQTTLEVLSPMEYSRDVLAQQSLNNTSLVIKLVYKRINLLFTGDIETPVEERLLDTDHNLKSNILKVGHHGSITSSSEDFIARVNPSFAVISVGEHNKFGHPSQFVLDRLEERGIKVYRTDQSGAITFTTNGYEVNVESALP